MKKTGRELIEDTKIFMDLCWFNVEDGDKTLSTLDNLLWEGLKDKKEFKKEMKKELNKKWKQVFEDARFLLKKAKKLDLI